MKIGQNVKILRKDIANLKHRKNPKGVITAINGEYLLVRPMWCKWEIELYPNEVQ
jgi:hypothetical protein